MTETNIKAILNKDEQTIWNTITTLEHCEWRSDISRIEVTQPGKQFIEYTNDGYPTTFTITVFRPWERYELEMDNTNMHGHWIGIIKKTDSETEISFTEQVDAKRIIMKPFVKAYLKKQQQLYLQDLRKALEDC